MWSVKCKVWSVKCKVWSIASARQNDFRHASRHMSETRLNVTKRHACHAKRSNAMFETSKSDPFCRTYHRHGHTALARTVADGCERLRTAADVNATSSEHTLNPQTPRVKREPLLRVLEKITWNDGILDELWLNMISYDIMIL